MVTPQVICVLGMHRAGSSVAARMLNILGVNLGPRERLLGPEADNEKGFWEHRGLLKVNEAILRRYGGSWSDPPRFPSGWAYDYQLDDLRKQARDLIEADFALEPLWGWKDPRNSLTLPFWQQLIPGMRYVICLRNPLDSALSLQRRNGLSLAQGIDLWLVYVRSAYEHTSGHAPLPILYEEVMADWGPALSRIATFLGSPEIGGRSDIHEATASFIDYALRHHHNASGTAAREIPREVVIAVEQIYRSISQGNDRKTVALLDETRQLLRSQLCRERTESYMRWENKCQAAVTNLDDIVPLHGTLILIGRDELPHKEVVKDAIPFIERDGQYWGPPADDVTAIRELERLRRMGATRIAVAWPAFWWLDYYTEFDRYLRTCFPCVCETEWLIAFDLSQRKTENSPSGAEESDPAVTITTGL